ncbi:hypothetical protein CsatB_011907 [Cannabis sativa]
MDINGGEGIVGQFDEKVKKVFGFVIKVTLDLCLAGCIIYFIVQALRNMKSNQQTKNDNSFDYVTFFALMFCFLIIFLLIIHLIVNCHFFINDVIHSPKVEPFQNDNTALHTAP